MTIPKVLITGATGFIGRHLIHFLSDKPCQLYALVRKRQESVPCPQILGSISDERAIEKAVSNKDTVIHMDSIIDSNNKDIEKVNVGGTETLLKAARSAGVAKIIYLSTENVLFDIKNKYTITKRKAEARIQSFPNFTIIRPSVVYGKGERSYFQKLLHVVQKWPVVPIIGNGQNKLQPIYVGDVVYCIYQALARDLRGVYTISGGNAMTYEALISLMMQHLKIRKRKLFIPIPLLYPGIAIYQRLYARPIMDVERLRNFYLNKTHDVSECERIFEIRFKHLDEGIGLYLKEEICPQP